MLQERPSTRSPACTDRTSWSALAIFTAGLLSSALLRATIPARVLCGTAGLYWHFVDIIWFFVVSQVYYW
jgi:hypothetical protein